ncbi:MAG: caspase family protein [Ilumatobacteraceae bacterium]
MTTYALLVGIDAYDPPMPPLFGCRNDIEALAELLRNRSGRPLDLRLLLDAEATRDAVVEAFRAHLGQAGPDDVALFAYAGHGSEEPAPPEVADVEPTGRIQTLILHDCNRRVGGKLRRALADKELALLLAEVSQSGAHVVVILDCCHAGGGTRDPFVRTRGWVPDADVADPSLRELVEAMGTARASNEFMPGAMDMWRAPRPPHVAIAACRSYETAKEHPVGRVTRGVFSMALVESLQALVHQPTYRSLLAAVRARVERSTDQQRPELFPLDVGGAGDGLVLDGTIVPVPPSFTMRRSTDGRDDGWEVDAGLVHGLRDAVGDDAFVLACTAPDGAAAGTAVVVAVDVGRSRVDPVGWTPLDVAYRAVVADVPLAPAEIRFDDGVGDATRDLVMGAVRTAGPGGGPSPFVRIASGIGDGDEVGRAGAPAPLILRVAEPDAGRATIARADGRPVTAAIDDVTAVGGGARLLVARLEHVSRWEQIRRLADHPAPLADAVELLVYAAGDDEARRPESRAPLAPDAGYELAYRPGSGGSWVAPRVFLELRNRHGRDLYVAVLDLTDRFRCHAVLPTELVTAGHDLALWSGAPIPVELPSGRAVVSGSSATDWLLVVVSAVDFDATTFDLGALDDPVRRSAAGRSMPRNAIERLATKALRRDVGAPVLSGDAAGWAATAVAVEVRVPDQTVSSGPRP